VENLNKRIALTHRLGRLSVDFVSLQETRNVAGMLSLEECSAWLSHFRFLSVASMVSALGCDTVLLYRPIYSLIKSLSDADGRFVMGEFQRRGITFRFACLFFPVSKS